MDNLDKITSFLKRNNPNCKLIAASKTRDINEIKRAKDNGINHFGENYIQEAIDKISAFEDCTLHLIGHLQSNKSKQAVKYFDYIHSVDRKNLVKELEKECIKQGRGELKIFIQVNQAGEKSKGGVSKNDLASVINYIKTNCKHLNLIGLMAIPPKDSKPETYFKELKELAYKHNLKELSMGMSNDYQDAVKNGATFVRIGSAIFGSRQERVK